jgi:hypothetical protein
MCHSTAVDCMPPSLRADFNTMCTPLSTVNCGAHRLCCSGMVALPGPSGKSRHLCCQSSVLQPRPIGAVRNIHNLRLQLSTPRIGRPMGLLGTQGGLVGNASVCAMRRRGTHLINDPSRNISTHRPTWGPLTVFHLRPHHPLARTMILDRMLRTSLIVSACIRMTSGFQRSAISLLRHDGYRFGLCIVRLGSRCCINESCHGVKARRRRT